MAYRIISTLAFHETVYDVCVLFFGCVDDVYARHRFRISCAAMRSAARCVTTRDSNRSALLNSLGLARTDWDSPWLALDGLHTFTMSKCHRVPESPSECKRQRASASGSPRRATRSTVSCPFSTLIGRKMNEYSYISLSNLQAAKILPENLSAVSFIRNAAVIYCN